MNTDLSALIARLETSGEDRELPDDIARAVFGPTFTFTHWGEVKDALTSLDAALAFAEAFNVPWRGVLLNALKRSDDDLTRLPRTVLVEVLRRHMLDARCDICDRDFVTLTNARICAACSAEAPSGVSGTIAALKELRASFVPRTSQFLKAIDEAVEGLEGLADLRKAILGHTPLIDMHAGQYVEMVRDTEAGRRGALARAEAAEAKLATALEGLEEARRVIGPFAHAAIEWDDVAPAHGLSGNDALNVGHLRAARAWRDKHGKAGQ